MFKTMSNEAYNVVKRQTGRGGGGGGTAEAVEEGYENPQNLPPSLPLLLLETSSMNQCDTHAVFVQSHNLCVFLSQLILPDFS